MEKNIEYEGKVLSLGTEGEGIIKCGQHTAFVPFCAEGEEVRFKALKVAGGVAYGKLTEILHPSADRVAPVCPHFQRCGGCQLQHLNYSAQLAFKRQLVKTALKKIGNIDIDVRDCKPSQKEYGYRNKLALPVGVDENGKTVVGFFAPRSHRIVPIASCPLQADWSAPLIASLLKFMQGKNLRGYDALSGKGDVRHLVAREVDGKLIVTVVATKKINLEGFAKILGESFEGFTLWLNENDSRSNVIFGEKWHICSGEGYFYGEACGVKFKAGANTFLQVNDGVRTRLYSAAVAAAAEVGGVAIDLYSGGGMMTAMLAKACGSAYGIEVVKQAVDCADELKNLNGLQGNMFNLCGRVEDRIGEVLSRTEGRERVIVCDPPRKGMERSVIQAVLASGARRVVLISCNPATLARDLGLLTGALTEEDGMLKKSQLTCGVYKIDAVTPYDMFPQTKHVETLVVLSHKKPAGHIVVTVDMDDTAIDKNEIVKKVEKRQPQEKTTYKKIQAWIEEHYGFKVHTAYIAEVKRELGLPMYDAPNGVEELKRPRQHPTPKMVEAIKAALKHFNIIKKA